MYLVAEIKN